MMPGRMDTQVAKCAVQKGLALICTMPPGSTNRTALHAEHFLHRSATLHGRPVLVAQYAFELRACTIRQVTRRTNRSLTETQQKLHVSKSD